MRENLTRTPRPLIRLHWPTLDLNLHSLNEDRRFVFTERSHALDNEGRWQTDITSWVATRLIPSQLLGR